METEFVVRNPALLGVAENTVRAADHVLQVLGETSERIGPELPGLADAFDAIADVLQAAVMKHTGIDVRRVGSAPTDAEIGQLALNSIRVNLGYLTDSKNPTEFDLRNRQQLVATTIHAYRVQLKRGNTKAAAGLLEQALATVETISNCLGQVESSSTPHVISNRVILVEQDRQEREVLRQILTDHDLDVRSFADDASALQLVLANPLPATLILNVQHAESGSQSIRQIREHARAGTIRLIGTSAMPLSDLQMLVDSEGVDQWFQKPFDPKVLLDTIATQGTTSQAA